MKKWNFTLILTLLVLGSFAQEKHKTSFKFKISDLSDTITDIKLARYHGKKLYYADTAKVSKNGSILFNKAEGYVGGMYALVLPGPKLLEVLYSGEENISIETSVANPVKDIKVKESSENKFFYDYLAFLNSKRGSVEPLTNRYKLIDSLGGFDKEKEEIKETLKSLDGEVKEYQKKKAFDVKGKFAADIIKMTIEVDVPDAPKDAEGNIIDSSFQYNYYKDHYFDNFNLSDEKIVNVSAFANRIDDYFDKVVIKSPDSIITASDYLISKLEPGSEVFKYVVHQMTYKAESSQIIGMDAVFVHLVEKYYKTRQAFWYDDEQLAKITERANKLSPLLIGKEVYNLRLPDSTEKTWYNLHDIESKLKVLIFWDPGCGHCKKELPRLAEYYRTVKGKGIEIFSVAKTGKDWTKFINDHKLNFINVGVPQVAYKDSDWPSQVVQQGKTDSKSLNYADTFDVFSTPKTFLIDENNKIVMKHLSVEQLEKHIARIMEWPTPEKSDVKN